ncbi:MAG: cyclic nucleotide-binding domain-containing protein [Rhodospirillales bacterium]
MHRLSVAPGEVIYRMGEASERAFVVLSGEVATVRGETTVTSGKGALIGFSGLFNRPYGATATALTASTVLVFSRKELRALIRSSPDESTQIIEAIIDVLGRVASELERLSDG